MCLLQLLYPGVSHPDLLIQSIYLLRDGGVVISHLLHRLPVPRYHVLHRAQLGVEGPDGALVGEFQGFFLVCCLVKFGD